MKMAELIGRICDKYKTKWIFKACYDKDCRSSPDSFHGLGLEEGLRVLERVRTEIGLPVTSDFSDAAWGPATGEVCDMVQVPAYLCRQTSYFARRRSDWQTSTSQKRAIYGPWNMKIHVVNWKPLVVIKFY